MDLAGRFQDIVIGDSRVGLSQLQVDPRLIQQRLRIDTIRRIDQVVLELRLGDPFVLLCLADSHLEHFYLFKLLLVHDELLVNILFDIVIGLISRGI